MRVSSARPTRTMTGVAVRRAILGCGHLLSSGKGRSADPSVRGSWPGEAGSGRGRRVLQMAAMAPDGDRVAAQDGSDVQDGDDPSESGPVGVLPLCGGLAEDPDDGDQSDEAAEQYPAEVADRGLGGEGGSGEVGEKGWVHERWALFLPVDDAQ